MVGHVAENTDSVLGVVAMRRVGWLSQDSVDRFRLGALDVVSLSAVVVLTIEGYRKLPKLV